MMKPFISPHRIEQLAIRQLLDYQSNNPGTCFSEPGFNINVVAAYNLQDAVTNLRVKSGERVIGYKVGCTGPSTRTQFGMDGPIRGTLFAGEALRNGAFINPNQFCHLAIEGEMALKIGEDYQIEAVFPVIELHNFIFRAQQKTLSELIANNGLNAGLVMPDIEWQNSSKHIQTGANLAIILNGVEIGNAGLWPDDDGPEASLNWLIGNLRDSEIKLNPGDIVLAGTALGLYPVKNGDDVIVRIDDKPTVNCKIEI